MTPSVCQRDISDVHEAFPQNGDTRPLRRRRDDARGKRNTAWQGGEYARLMAQEMGKPVRDGVAEVESGASVATSMPRMRPASWRASRSRPKRATVSSRSTRSASCSP